MWTEFNGGAEDWDSTITGLGSYHPTHLFHWGSGDPSGTKCLRLCFHPEQASSPTAAVQLIRKTGFWGGGYFRTDGGIAGDFSSLSTLIDWLNKYEKNRRWYLRMFHRCRRRTEDIIQCQSSGFSPVLSPIHTGLSANITLGRLYDPKYSGNWRHNLARATKKNLSVTFTQSPQLAEVHKIYRQLETTKNIGVQFTDDEIRHIITHFGEHLIVAEVRSPEGELMSLRGALVLGKCGFDLFAATSELGRNAYASNLAFHSLLSKCAERDVEQYDCAGIDPVNGKGVMQFKQGAGGTAFEYVGEWEYAPISFLKILFNALLAYKLKRIT